MRLTEWIMRRRQGEQLSLFAEPEPEDRPGNVKTTPADVDRELALQLQYGYIAFDVETTGLNPKTDRIVELGAVRFRDGKPVDTFSTLVNCGMPMSAASIAITQITNEMVKSAPSEDEVYGALMEFLGDAADGKTLMVAHNARFDMDFLRMTLMRLGVDADIRYADTLKLARQHVPGLFNYKQPTIAEHFGIEIHSAHRAADDARVCGEMLGKIVERILK